MRNKTTAGFTLIDILIGLALFSIVSFGVYGVYANILNSIVRNQWRTIAVSVLENQIETIRGMKYEDVGIAGGYPSGTISATSTVFQAGIPFLLTTTVRTVDDPFDGTATSTPPDISPADYKIVQLTATCRIDTCFNFNPISITTTVAPDTGLETASNNGSIFITTFDAYGKPVANANVTVTNNTLTPHILVNDTTNNDGFLALLDFPTSTMSYNIKVSKTGYSSDQTYPLGGASNPNPLKTDSTVAKQQITSVSFAIDKTSTVNASTRNITCGAIANSAFSVNGSKLIGTSPDVQKYSNTLSTDAGGNNAIQNLEWDNYQFANLNTAYDLIGSIPLLPINLTPATTTNVTMVLQPKNPSALLVTATDENGQPLYGASVTLTKSAFSKTLTTGVNTFSQTDWSNGDFSSKSPAIDTATIGKLRLAGGAGPYPTSSEWLVSNTFDLGTPNSQFLEIGWNATNPAQTGNNGLLFQVATNNDNATWNFTGPDGSPVSFYAVPGTFIHMNNNGNRYLRYKVFMQTADQNYTPEVTGVSFNHSSDCVPSGQAFLNGLSTGIYSIVISKTGYQTASSSNVAVSGNWQEYKALMPKQ